MLSCRLSRNALQCSQVLVGTSQQWRSFAKKGKGPKPKKNKSRFPKRKKKPASANQNKSSRTPRADQIGASTSSSQVTPPAMLLPTASPHVFVAKAAAEEAGILAPHLELFTEFTKPHQPHQQPRLFQPLEPIDFGGAAHPPETDSTPRIAFLGRSNVGKSSLLNALMRRDLAVTSKQPGRTQKVHYYGWMVPESNNGGGDSSSSDRKIKKNKKKVNPNNVQAYFVDLPGYGYAVGPDDAVQEWQRRTQQFLMNTSRTNTNHEPLLKRLYLLQDARVGPQPFDHTVQGWLTEAEIPYSVVLTKADGVRRPADLIKHVNTVCMQFHQQHELAAAALEGGGTFQSPLVHVTSAKSGTGLAELWSSIEADLLEL